MRGFLGRTIFVIGLGRASITFGLGPRTGGAPPPVAPSHGCMHLELAETAAMTMGVGETASLTVEVRNTASMTITLEDC